jgi:tRNA (cmo5U34)-methyltransferase
MVRDTLYASGDAENKPFEFNEDVARVFPDMLQRSIPGYAATLQAIGSLAARYVQPHSQCYDLGCSLGAASAAMLQNIRAPGCSVVAVDNAPAMVSRCRELLAGIPDQGVKLSVLEANIQDVPIDKASMVVLNYTLQFLPELERDATLRKIAAGMLDDGVLVLSEKVVDEDPRVEQLLVDLHHQFKRQNAYSEMEISRKRKALENVLVPETVATHRSRLLGAGFRHTGVWLRYLNFVSLVAIR